MEKQSGTIALQQVIQEELRPLVQSIDTDNYYPEEFLRLLGEKGYFNSSSLSDREVLLREFQLIEEVSKVCMTTGFNLWCQLTAQTYLRQSNNNYLKSHILPKLENGTLLGGTGLSNPMKFYENMEKLHLKAELTDGGYIISGNLPAVSNLGKGHWFGIIAGSKDCQRVMAFVPCDLNGLSLKSKSDYLGVNGSATYVCRFDHCFIPDHLILSVDADQFVEKIRPIFLLYQIPLGLGVTNTCINSIQRARSKQNGSNYYLQVQPEKLELRYQKHRTFLYNYLETYGGVLDWYTVVQKRLNVSYLTLRAVETNMLHIGGAGYLYKSHPARKLREAYFLVNLTPTVKQLEKILAGKTAYERQ